MAQLGYAATGVNPALSAHQFVPATDARFAWNLEVWGVLECGGPLDAPDYIPKGACHANWHPQQLFNRI